MKVKKSIDLDELKRIVFDPATSEVIRQVFYEMSRPQTGSRFAYKLHCTMKEELGPIELELAQKLISEANKADDFYVQFWDSLYNHRPALALANMPEANDDPKVESQAFHDFVNQHFTRDARAFVAGYLASKPNNDGNM